jgi:formylglycine-generating enzyme required for sulfatase activity
MADETGMRRSDRPAAAGSPSQVTPETEFGHVPRTDMPPAGSFRAIRGGCWGDIAARCRSAYRGGNNSPMTSYGNLGFRVALVPAGK